MGLTAGKHNVKLPADTAVDAEVDLLNTDGAFSLRARLNVTIPGVDRETAQAIADDAHQVKPLLEGDPRQHRRHHQRGLTRVPHRMVTCHTPFA